MRRRAASILAMVAMIGGAGCRPDAPSTRHESRETSQASPPLQLLIVDAPGLAQSIRQQWSVRSQDEIKVDNITLSDLEGGESRSADVIVYPSRYVGELAEQRRIVPLPKYLLADRDWDRSDIFDLVRLREITWGGQTVAVPFGSPQLVLYYRSDVMAYLNREPPETWEELAQLTQLLGRRDRLGKWAPPDTSPWYGMVQPLGPNWAGQVLLARAACYARHRGYYSTLFDYQTMEALIDGAPFIRALEELVIGASAGPPEAVTFSPWEARRMFLRGQCALALAWPLPRGAADEQPDDEDTVAVGYAELPGSEEVFNFRTQQWEARSSEDSRRVPLLGVAGRLGSVTRQSRQRQRSVQLLGWLTGRQMSGEIASRSKVTTLFRQSHRGRPEIWADPNVDSEAAKQYVDIVARAQSRKAVLITLRIPGRARYMAALDQAVHSAVAGEKSSQLALQEAAATWRQITDDLGRENQREAYRRSLGLAQAR